MQHKQRVCHSLKFRCLVLLPAPLEAPELFLALAMLYVGLRIHGSSGLLAFDSPVL